MHFQDQIHKCLYVYICVFPYVHIYIYSIYKYKHCGFLSGIIDISFSTPALFPFNLMIYQVIFPVCSQTFPVLHTHVTPYHGWILISFIRPLLKDIRVVSRFSPLHKYPSLDLRVPDFMHTSVQGRVLAEGRCLEVKVFGQRAREF